MQPQEYFAILPLLIYGIAIAELISPWRSFFEEKKPYFPFIITGIMMLEVAFHNFYQFFSFLNGTYQSYHIFLSYLLSPLIFLMASHVYTPESREKLDTRDYFHKKFRLLMVLLSAFVASHFIYDLNWDLANFMRLLFIAIMVIAGIFRQIWLVYVLILLRLYTAIFLIN